MRICYNVFFKFGGCGMRFCLSLFLFVLFSLDLYAQDIGYGYNARGDYVLVNIGSYQLDVNCFIILGVLEKHHILLRYPNMFHQSCRCTKGL